MEAVCFQKVAEMSEFFVDSFLLETGFVYLSKHG